MRELVLATISEQVDIEVVGEVEDQSLVTELVDSTRPDFLIISAEDRGQRPNLCGFLLGRYPNMRVLAVTERASSTFYWAFVDIRSKTVETSEEGILGALRSGSEAPNRVRISAEVKQ
jgi:hypothetical protein